MTSRPLARAGMSRAVRLRARRRLAGVGGTVAEVNAALANNPGLVNNDPYGQGWMIKLKADNPADVERLLSVEDYLKKTGH